MRFIAVTFFISLVVGDPGALLGKEECTYGPSYWCSNALNAKRCGAVKHCVDTVWTKTVITSKDTMECTLCKTAITEVKMMLKQNGTEEKIKEYVKEICDLLTDEAMKQMCTKFATTELPLLLDLIRSDMNPEQICSTIKMCTPGYVDTVQHKPVQDASAQTKMPAIQSSTVCTDCENFFKDIQNMIVSNETLEQLEDMLTQAVCSQLGPAKDMCNDVVKQFLPMILQYLGQLVDPATTCRIIGFCDTKRDLYSALKMRLDNKNIFMKFNKKSFGGQEECAVCKNVMTDLQNLDRDPTIQGKIEDFVKTQLCTLLGSLESECDKFVDENAPVLFQLLANELDPETVCSFVGFCRSVSVPKTSVPGISVVHLTKTQPIKALSLLPSLHIKKPVKTSGVLCSVCKVVMNELDSMLSKNATQDEIEKALKDVCNRLPAQLKDQCTDFVNQYAPAVIALLVQEMNPTTVCDTLGLCTPLTKKLKASIECVVCEFVMSEIEKILATNQTEAAVKSAFDKVCSLLPDTINTECTQFVNQYSSLIINLLINKVKPAQVCKALGLCKSTLTAVPKPFPGLLLRGEPVVQKQSLPVSLSEILLRGEPVLNAKPLIKKTDEECLVCKTILNYIDEALKENKTVEVIKQLLNKACEVLPTSMAQECEGIVIAFGDAIIKEIVQQLDPKQICTDIGLCQDKKSSKKSQTKKINTNEMIKTILEGRKKLENNVLYFQPRNPAQNRNPMKLVGEKKCTFGPSYWCKSYDTAKECGMIEHCKSKVWSRN